MVTWRFSEVIDKYEESTTKISELEIFVRIRQNQLAGLDTPTHLFKDSDDTYLLAFNTNPIILLPWSVSPVIISGDNPQGSDFGSNSLSIHSVYFQSFLFWNTKVNQGRDPLCSIKDVKKEQIRAMSYFSESLRTPGYANAFNWTVMSYMMILETLVT